MIIKLSKKYFYRLYEIMKIMPVYVYNTKTQRSVSFSSTDRFYRTDSGQEIGNNTWMFREDLDWRAFADF